VARGCANDGGGLSLAPWVGLKLSGHCKTI